MKTYKVWIGGWIEYDEGVQHDDGYSLHLTKADAEVYRHKMSIGDYGQYWRMLGLQEIVVSEEIYEQIKSHNGTLKIEQRDFRENFCKVLVKKS